MIRWIFLLLLAGSIFTSSAVAQGEVGGAPRIRCEIGTASWCIATFDGSINMKDGGDVRIWTLKATDDAGNAPMTVIENKSCSDMADERIKLIGSSQVKSSDGTLYHSTVYSLNSNGCKLDFRWPEDVASNSYKQTMLYGILVGYKKDTQLYRIK